MARQGEDPPLVFAFVVGAILPRIYGAGRVLVWQDARYCCDEEYKRPSGTVQRAEDLIPRGRHETFPKKMKPMMATLADAPFDDPDWVFEPKLDGIRVLAYIKGTHVEMISRNLLDLSSQFPALCEQLQEQYSRGMVLDAEIVAFQDGKPSFNAMLNRLHLKDAGMLRQMDSQIPVVMYVFDI